METNKLKQLVAASAFYSPERIDKMFTALKEGTKEDIAKLKFNIDSFMNVPNLFGSEAGRINQDHLAGALQAFVSTADIPEVVTNTFSVFRKMDNYDMRWEQAFNRVEFDPYRDFIEVISTLNGLVIDKMVEGEEVKFGKITGSRQIASAVEYGGGIQWPWRLVENRQWSTMVNMATEFRDRTINKKSQAHYSLLVEAANSQAIQALPSGATVLERNIKAINQIIGTIADDFKDESGIDAANQPILIYFKSNETVRARLQAAVNYVTVLGNQSPETITPRQIILLPTYMLKSAAGVALANSRPIAVLPGRKTQTADKVLPTVYTEEDIKSFSTIQTVRMSFASVVGDVKAVRAFDIDLT